MKREGRRLDRIDALVAAWIVVLYTTLLVRTAKDIGYARDEGTYFQSAQAYARWIELFFSDRSAATQPRAIDAIWSVNHEHPSLMKSLFAISGAILQPKLHLFALEGTSYRFPAMVVASLGVALVYLWGAEARSRAAGFAAAVALGAMPAFFFHAHLACFDAPIATTWALAAYAYWKSLRKGGALFPILAGLAFGIALDTKHNSWFLPIAATSHAAALLAVTWMKERDRFGVRLKRALATLVAMAAIGPMVLVALWPWLWHAPVARFEEWVKFHLNHDYYNMEFLGVNYWKAPMPRGYAWVMTAATVPAITLALFVVGLVVIAMRDARAWKTNEPVVDDGGTHLLWLVGLCINYAAWLSPSTPIFGGTKHWLTAYPFLALFAGVGFDAALRALRMAIARARRRSPALEKMARANVATAFGFGALVALPAIVETAHAGPWGLAFYTPLVGGQAGAATLGLNRSFWGYATGATTEYLNTLPKNSSVFVHDTTLSAWDMLQKDGRLRRDLRGTGSIAQASAAIYHHELHMLGHEYADWSAFGTDRPAFVAGLDGVPVVWVYRRP